MFRFLTKKDFSILIGNICDHYDTALYSFLAPKIAAIFFPNHEPLVQLILIYSVLCGSIITRPIGSIIFGVLVYRKGPINGLAYSLIGIALATFMIGCLPTYSRIGWLAPLLLIILRMLIGVFAAGETLISKLYMLESKTYIYAFKTSYLYEISTIIGIIAASTLSSIAIEMHSQYSWRICFWLGGLTGLIGLLIRRYSLPDSMSVEELSHESIIKNTKTLITEAAYYNKIKILKIAIMTNFGYITYLVPFIIMSNIVPLITDIKTSDLLKSNSYLLIIDLLLIVITGEFCKKFNSRLLIIVSCSILSLSILPLMIMLPNASSSYIIFLQIWIIFFGVIAMLPINIFIKNLLNTNTQYFLNGIGSSLGASIGHFTPLICLTLWYYTNNILSIALYLSVMIALTVLVGLTSNKQ